MPGDDGRGSGRGRRARAHQRGRGNGWQAVTLATVAALSAAGIPAAAQQGPGSKVAQLQRAEAPRIKLPPNIVAAPNSRVPLQIAIEPSEGAPRQSFLRLEGLPTTASLTEGYSIAPGNWAVPLNGLARLELIVPVGSAGSSEIIVKLVSADGTVISETKSSLVVAPMPAEAPRRGPPAMTPADREAAERMVARGERDMADGNVALARGFFQRAADAGLAKGAMLLAGTYDGRELARMRVQGVQPNPAMARKWYERARELGAPEADERLSTLSGG